MTDSGTCERCNHVWESTLHAVRDCDKAAAIWKLLLPPDKWRDFFSKDLHDWIKMNLLQKDNSHMIDNIPWSTMFVVSVWTIWRERNSFIFRKESRDCHSSVVVISNHAQEITLMNSKLSSLKTGRMETLVGWVFPEQDWIKCNVDGACKDGGLRTGCGGVFRDSSGVWVTGFKRGLGVGSVLSAELWGILIGIQIAWNRGIRKLWIESDSLIAVNLVRKGCLPSHQYHNLVCSIRSYMDKQWHLRVTHTHREGNRVADALANEGSCNGPTTLFLHSPPFCVIDLLRDDSSEVSLPRFVSSSSLV